MKKKILSLVLTAALLLSVPGCSKKPAETTTPAVETVVTDAETTTTASDATTTTPETTVSEAAATSPEREYTGEELYDGELTPAVWKVTDRKSGNSLYMMGTIHLIPDTKDIVPQYMLDIYENSDGVAVEYDVTRLSGDMVAAIQYLSYYVLDDGSAITDHISQETYERAKAYLTDAGLYQEGFEAYNSAYWESLVSNAALLKIEGMSESGIDTYFIGLAKNDGKEVRDIERLETQMDALTLLSDGYNEYAINSLLDDLEEENGYEEFKDSFLELYTAWAQGDIDVFGTMEDAASDEIPDEYADEYAEYNRRLLDERNIGMADVAEQYIKNGDNIFYMVGFGHFCGDGSVIDLLAQRGYTVERIY